MHLKDTNELRALRLNTETNTVEEIFTFNDIENYAELLKCDDLLSINGVPVTIRGKEYKLIYIDDENIVKDRPVTVMKNGKVFARGNILLCNFDKDEIPCTLNEDDVPQLLRAFYVTVEINKLTGNSRKKDVILNLDSDNDHIVVIKDKNGKELLN